MQFTGGVQRAMSPRQKSTGRSREVAVVQASTLACRHQAAQATDTGIEGNPVEETSFRRDSTTVTEAALSKPEENENVSTR